MQRSATHGWTLAGFGALVCWSASVALARSLSEQVGPVTGAAAVYLAGGALMAAGTLASPLRRRELAALPRLYLCGCGGLFVAYILAFYTGIGLAANRDETLEIGMLNYLWPTLTMVFSLWLLRRRANGWLVPGTFMAVGGAWLSLTQHTSTSPLALLAHVGGNPVAYAGGLLAAITWALYSNLSCRWGGEGRRGGVALFLPATGVVLLILRFMIHEDGAWTPGAATEAVLLGVLTVIGYSLWDMAMRRGDFVLVVAGSYFTPLLSTLVSCIYLAVLPGPKLWLGGVLIVAGSLLSWRSFSRTPALTPTREQVTLR